MFTKALLTAAVVIGTATAQVPAIAKRDFLESRQLDSGLPDGLDVDPKCQSALTAVSTLYTSLPTPAADLLSVTLPTDPCVTPTFTGKLESEWNSYTSAALQWYSSHSDELLNFVTACSGLIDGSQATDLPVCSSDLASPGASTTPAQTTTGSSSASTITGVASSGAASSSGAGASAGASQSTSPSSTVSTPNAAPRETGFVFAAAVAAAGFMGAVAAL
ncbi:hypothetical protein F4803DRAFT_558748 [Xylaria telfairii]|nr:hypothetical protein F4803DRAFT_558748 [Xylaria telfairii]